MLISNVSKSVYVMVGVSHQLVAKFAQQTISTMKHFAIESLRGGSANGFPALIGFCKGKTCFYHWLNCDARNKNAIVVVVGSIIMFL